LVIGKNTKDVDALPNFKFQISSFDIGIQFDNTRFFEKSVNWYMKDAKYFIKTGLTKRIPIVYMNNQVIKCQDMWAY